MNATSQEQVVVIMGGAHGIGLACTETFLNGGAKVLFADIDENRGLAAERRLDENFPDAVEFRPVDVAQEDDVRHAVDAAAARWKRLDTLVNVVGINRPGSLDKIDNDDMTAMFNTNLRGTISAIQATIPHMRQQGGGAIVNIGSVHARLAYGGYGLYAMCKAGLEALTRELAVELGPELIRINTVGPGYVPLQHPERWAASLNPAAREAFWRDWAPQLPAGEAFSQPLHQACLPEDIANAVHFFASPMARCISGQTLYVDGALTASFFMSGGNPKYVKRQQEFTADWKAWFAANRQPADAVCS